MPVIFVSGPSVTCESRCQCPRDSPLCKVKLCRTSGVQSFPKCDSGCCCQEMVRETLLAPESLESPCVHSDELIFTDPCFVPFRPRGTQTAPFAIVVNKTMCQMVALHGHLFPSPLSASRPHGTWNSCSLIGLTVRQSCLQSAMASWASMTIIGYDHLARVLRMR